MISEKNFAILIGNRLKELRLNNKYSLEEVGIKINKTKRTIKAYEDAEISISIVILKQLVEDVYGVRLGTFFNELKY